MTKAHIRYGEWNIYGVVGELRMGMCIYHSTLHHLAYPCVRYLSDTGPVLHTDIYAAVAVWFLLACCEAWYYVAVRSKPLSVVN